MLGLGESSWVGRGALGLGGGSTSVRRKLLDWVGKLWGWEGEALGLGGGSDRVGRGKLWGGRKKALAF